MHACHCKFRNCQAVYVSMTSDDVIVLYRVGQRKVHNYEFQAQISS